MTSEFRKMQELQAARDLETKIFAHREKQFDIGSLDSTTRHILRKGGVRITAAATINGLMTEEVDKVLENYFRDYPSATEMMTRVGVKLALRSAGVLMSTR